MEGKNVKNLASKQDERQRYEVSGKHQQSGDKLHGKKKAEKCEAVIAVKNCKATGFVGGG
jgi:hypothetical protein